MSAMTAAMPIPPPMDAQAMLGIVRANSGSDRIRGLEGLRNFMMTICRRSQINVA
jgi:hypothetical protein